MPKRAEVIQLLARLNKTLGGDKGEIILQTGAEIQWLSASRYPTGSLGLDIALNGGVPKGAVVQFVGEESAAKTTMALKTCAAVQRLYGQEAAIAWIAVEAFDKQWANTCGVSIPFTKDELKLMRARERERFATVQEIGTFTMGTAVSGEDALQIALEMIRSGLFHLVVIDSIAALPTLAELDKAMDENTMTQLPRLMGKFIKKCYSAFNTKLENGKRNETAVILINQVRDKIGGYGHPAPEPPGGRALRHASHATVRFVKGEIFKDTEGDDKTAYARRMKTKVEKCKIGPPFREADFDLYFEPRNHFHPGEIDTFQEIRIWGVKAELVKQTGNTSYQFNGRKFQGKRAVEEFFRKHPREADALRVNILRALTSGEVD